MSTRKRPKGRLPRVTVLAYSRAELNRFAEAVVALGEHVERLRQLLDRVQRDGVTKRTKRLPPITAAELLDQVMQAPPGSLDGGFVPLPK